jgi:hypothetical protein
MTLIEKVKASDFVEFFGGNYVYVGYDDIEGVYQFKMKDEYIWEQLIVSDMERYYDNGTLKLYKMVEL